MNTKVSVIIPVFNVESYIQECLQSVVNQNMTEGIECILIDDCGKDESVSITEDLIKGYNGPINFRFLHHEQNKGLSAARNTGIQAAKGKYLFFLDSDDKITPDCIRMLFELAERYNADLVQGTYLGNHPVLSGFHKQFTQFTDNRSFIKNVMLDYDQFPVMAQNRLVNKSIILDNDVFFREGIIHEDHHWTFFLAKYISRLAICTTPSYYYRITPGSITNKMDVSKERKSFSILLKEYCDNFDSFLLGDQKHSALKVLMMALAFQDDQEERNALFMNLYNRCNVLEKIALSLWFKTKKNCAFKGKMFNLCVRMFRLSS